MTCFSVCLFSSVWLISNAQKMSSVRRVQIPVVAVCVYFKVIPLRMIIHPLSRSSSHILIFRQWPGRPEFNTQVESYQRPKKWYWMPPCWTLSIIRYGSKVKWSNPGKGVASSSTPQCSSYRKGSLRVTLDWGRQLYLPYLTTHTAERKFNVTNTHLMVSYSFSRLTLIRRSSMFGLEISLKRSEILNLGKYTAVLILPVEGGPSVVCFWLGFIAYQPL